MAKKKFVSLMMCLMLASASAGAFSACDQLIGLLDSNGSVTSSTSQDSASSDNTSVAEFKVQFNSLGGSEVPSQMVQKGAKVEKPEDPTRDGYTFVEWQLNGNTYDFDTPVTGAITLKAKWVPNEAPKFAVTFMVEGETEPFYTAEVSEGKKAVAPSPEPTRAGYAFVGWTLNGVAYDFETPVTQAITLVAKWATLWTVTFDAGETEPFHTAEVVDGGSATAPTEVPTRAGYIFDYWTLNGEAYDFETPVTQAITLVAKWANEWTVTFDVGEGSAVAPVAVKDGDTITAPATERYGHYVSGWLLDGEAFAFETPITGDITLTAVWAREAWFYDNQIGLRVYGNDLSADKEYLTVTTDENDVTVITAKFKADATYSPALILKNLSDKSVYETMIAEGKEVLTFNLAVEGDVTELYVFGKALSSFPEENGVYTVSIKLQHVVDAYAVMYDIATLAKAGQASSFAAKFISWKSPAGDYSTVRNYVFTITDVELKALPTASVDFATGSAEGIKVGETTTLVASSDWEAEVVWSSSDETIATVANGVVTGVKAGEVVITATLGGLITVEKTVYVLGNTWDTDNFAVIANAYNQPTYVSTEKGANGELSISAKFQGNEWRWPAVVLRNLESKAYYQALIANGYTKLVFNLAVGGDNAENVSDLYIFGQLLSTYPENNGVYAIAVDVQYIVDNYDTIGKLGTSLEAKPSLYHNQMLISWKCTASNASTTRNYVFTLSNVEYKSAPTVNVSANKTELAYGETATLTATTNWSNDFVVWTTSDSTIATVVDGVVTVTGENWGEVTITATVAGVSEEVVITVKAPTFSVEFAEGSADTIYVNGTTTLTVNTNVAGDVVWSTSDETIAMVVNGVVTGVKAGEVTITATLNGLTASETVKVIYHNQIGARINGNDVTANPNYLQVTAGENGATVITAKFQADATYSPALTVRHLADKAVYEGMIAEGKTSLAFNLVVNGDVSDLYIFGKALSSFPNTDGVYAVVVRLQRIVDYYDTIKTLATSDKAAGQASSLSAKFISWKSPAGDYASVRNYVFTITDVVIGDTAEPTFSVEFAEGSADTIYTGETTTLEVNTNVAGDVVWSTSDETIATVANGVVTGVKAGEVTITATLNGLTASETVKIIYHNQIGARINGNDVTANMNYLQVTAGENGATVIMAKFQADGTYSPALILKNLSDKSVYEAMIAEGKEVLTFNLAVDGDVSELYIFGKALSSFPNTDGVYAVIVKLQHIVNHYDTIKTLATSDKAAGQASSLSAKFISWKSPADDYTSVRNYVFTITDTEFKALPTVSVDFAEGCEENIARGETTTLTVTTDWSEDFVEWTTSDSTIATVVDGVVTATGENWGEVTITATVAGVSKEVVITVKAPETLSINFAEGTSDIVEANDQLSFIVETDWKVEGIEWSSSDETIATVENGVVTGLKSGKVTITATLGDLKSEKTVYVVGGLNSDQIGMRINGYQYQDKPAYFNMDAKENGDMVITTMFSDSQTYYPMLMLRNMHSKEDYQHLLDNGYEKLTFMLTVSGDNVSDLYVFGRQLTSFPQNADGAYAIAINVEYIITYYDNIYGIATSTGQAGTSGSLDKMFIAWKSPLTWAGSRNYVFTISNCAYNKGFITGQIGMRVQGNVVTGDTDYMTMDIGENGEMIIEANFEATAAVDGQGYHAGLLFADVQDKAYYQGLIDSGYTYLTFDLKIDGTDKDKLSDMYLFCGQQMSGLTKEGDVYKVKILLSDVVRLYDAAIDPIDPLLGGRKGTTGSRSGMFIAWRDNRGTDIGTTRNYIFTISNTMYE